MGQREVHWLDMWCEHAPNTCCEVVLWRATRPSDRCAERGARDDLAYVVNASWGSVTHCMETPPRCSWHSTRCLTARVRAPPQQRGPENARRRRARAVPPREWTATGAHRLPATPNGARGSSRAKRELWHGRQRWSTLSAPMPVPSRVLGPHRRHRWAGATPWRLWRPPSRLWMPRGRCRPRQARSHSRPPLRPSPRRTSRPFCADKGDRRVLVAQPENP